MHVPSRPAPGPPGSIKTGAGARSALLMRAQCYRGKESIEHLLRRFFNTPQNSKFRIMMSLITHLDHTFSILSDAKTQANLVLFVRVGRGFLWLYEIRGWLRNLWARHRVHSTHSVHVPSAPARPPKAMLHVSGSGGDAKELSEADETICPTPRRRRRPRPSAHAE